MTDIKTLSVEKDFGSISYSPSVNMQELINSLDEETRDELEKRIRSELEGMLLCISIDLTVAADHTSSNNHNNHTEDVEDDIWDYPDPPTTSAA